MNTQPIPATPTELAQALGFPATLFDFTPAQRAYWFEPGLPWLTAEQMHGDQMPLDRRGHKAILCVGYLDGHHMAPRFPKGCEVQTAPVFDRANLVLGRVYTYRYRDGETGAWCHEMGRLVKIGGNFLEVKADNNPVPSLWLLGEVPGQEVWDVREVTHYVSYPGEDEQLAARE